MSTKNVDGSPTKEFFVYMITRDISLEDCILDLLDNCIDGANKVLNNNNRERKADYDGFKADINFDESSFMISDNCGGISIENATEYAFHFGRKSDTPQDLFGSIGLYGIGMKRAFLKIGSKIIIESSTQDEAFEMEINVDEWLAKGDEDWNFELTEVNVSERVGTKILVKEIKKDIKKEFSDPAFFNNLYKMIARDYSFFLQNGFKVFVNNEEVQPYEFVLKSNEAFKPINFKYSENLSETNSTVNVEILAGLAGLPPDQEETLPEVMEERKDTEYYGWFVTCNDRVVLPSDKSEKTVWGRDNFTKWHPQYNGFMGIIRFKSDDPNLLPWTTTKRNIDLSNPLYKRAITKMKEATKPYIDYTTARKNELDKAKELEKRAENRPLKELEQSEHMVLPSFSTKKRKKMTTISYQRAVEEVKKVKLHIGGLNTSNKEVGIKSFEYYLENEIEL